MKTIKLMLITLSLLTLGGCRLTLPESTPAPVQAPPRAYAEAATEFSAYLNRHYPLSSTVYCIKPGDVQPQTAPKAPGLTGSGKMQVTPEPAAPSAPLLWQQALNGALRKSGAALCTHEELCPAGYVTVSPVALSLGKGELMLSAVTPSLALHRLYLADAKALTPLSLLSVEDKAHGRE